MSNLCSLFLFAFLIPFSGWAQSNSGIVFQGRVTAPDGSVVVDPAAQFTVQIYGTSENGDERCLLFEETHAVNLAKTNGSFNLTVGEAPVATQKCANSQPGQFLGLPGSTSTGVNMAGLFMNPPINGKSEGYKIKALSCQKASGSNIYFYPDSVNADRELAVSVTLSSGKQLNLGSMPIRSVPFSMQAAQIGGYGAKDLFKVNPTASYPSLNIISQTSADFLIGLFDGTNVNIQDKKMFGVKTPGTTETSAVANVDYVNTKIAADIASSAVTSVSVSAPLVLGGSSNAPSISIPAATATSAGFLSAGDYDKFNKKFDATIAAPATGQVIRYNGSGWSNSPIGVTDLPALVGQVSGPLNNTVIGNDTISSAKIVDGAVTNAKIADGSVNDAKISGVAFGKLSGKPTDLAGYGITDAVKNNGGVPSLQSGLDAAIPATASVGQMYFASDSKKIYRHDGAAWVVLAQATGGQPGGAAGGDLTGNYPNPSIAALAVDSGKLANDAVTNAKIANSAVNDAKISDVAFGKLSGKPNTLSGYGIGDGVQNVGASVPSIQAGDTNSRPDPSVAGRIYIDTQTGFIYRDSGSDWSAVGGSVNAITGLTGDVTASGPGSVGATVATVGGISAANVASGASLANTATSANTADQIIRRNASGGFSAGIVNVSEINASATVKVGTGTCTGSIADLGKIQFSGGSLQFCNASGWQTVGTTTGGVQSLALTTNSLLPFGISNSGAAYTLNMPLTAGSLWVGNMANVPSEMTAAAGEALVYKAGTGWAGQSLGGDVKGGIGTSVVDKVGGVAAASVASGASLANAATSANTNDQIVRRSATGGFSAGAVSVTSLSSTGGISATNFVASGTVQVATGACSAMGDAGKIQYIGGSLQFCNGTGWQTVGTTSGGVQSLSFTTNALQAVGITNVSAAYTLNLPNATASNGGLLSASDFDTFNKKQTANLTTGRIWLGNAGSAQEYSGAAVNQVLMWNGSAWAATSLASSNLPSLGGDVSGTIASNLVDKVGGLAAASVASGAILANAATSANTNDQIVRRSASGGFSAGAVSVTSLSSTGTVSGNFLSSASSIKVGTDTNCGAGDDGKIRFNGSALAFCKSGVWTDLGEAAGSGTVPVTKGGTGSTTLAGKGLLYMNPAGSQTLSLNCTANQMIQFDASAVPSCVAAPTTIGQVMKWNGSAWAPGTDSDTNSGGTVTSVTGSGPITVTNGSTTPAISISNASASSVGVVQVGSNISVAAGGIISISNTNVTSALGYTPVNKVGDTMTGPLNLSSVPLQMNGVPVIDANGGWHRTYGQTGWYSETYGGGWYMTDTSWVRSYAGKNVWTDGQMGAHSGLTIGYGGASAPANGAIVSGNVGIGTTNPQAKLEVAGSVTLTGGAGASTTNTVATGTIVDLSKSNIHFLKSTGAAINTVIDLSGGVNGGTYTIIVNDTQSKMYTFGGSCITANTYFSPANDVTSFRSTYTILIVDDGGQRYCYVAWMTGFN